MIWEMPKIEWKKHGGIEVKYCEFKEGEDSPSLGRDWRLQLIL